VDVERDFLRVRIPVLIAKAIGMLSGLRGVEGMVPTGYTRLVGKTLLAGAFDLDGGNLSVCLVTSQGASSPESYPEVHLKVSTRSELPIANLECHGHPVARIQVLEKALPRVSLELDVVGRRKAGEACN
jgi:hypothetical protein